MLKSTLDSSDQIHSLSLLYMFSVMNCYLDEYQNMNIVLH